MNSKIKILVDDKEIDYYAFADELRNGDYFFKENGEWYLHKRPTIIEDKKIEFLPMIEEDAMDIDYLAINQTRRKINEIIVYINKEK